MKLLSVVIPVFNEERTIAQVIANVLSAPLPQGFSLEIVIVNDGSKDKTADILKQCVKDPRIRIFHQDNQGKTSALLKGFKEAAGEFLLVQDADLEYDPRQYPQLLQPIVDGKTDVVYGSRFLGRIDAMEPVNRWANVMSNLTLRVLYRAYITDVNTCFKVFPRVFLNKVTIVSKNFAFETEVTVKLLKQGVRIVEVPIKYVARTREQGKKIDWVKALEMYWPLIKYRFVN
ncbi:MAG: glycosyltransferase family 2 protein [Candidatus Omnitrophica bacterium]|nr:glycosyltransferase family 2 protein [Candidatus Omnitrophota bacterium]